MSDVSGGDGWWMASDGKWYPPETHPDRQAASVQAQPPIASQPTPEQPVAPQSTQQLPGPVDAPAQSLEPPGQASQPLMMPPEASEGAPKKRKRGRWIIAAAIVVVVVVVAVVVAGSKGSGNGGLPAGKSLAEFEHDIVQDAQSTSQGPGLPNAHSASCIMPSTWSPGQTFKCFVYNSNGGSVATLNGTVLPTRPGDNYSVNARWTPGN